MPCIFQSSLNINWKTNQSNSFLSRSCIIHLMSFTFRTARKSLVWVTFTIETNNYEIVNWLGALCAYLFIAIKKGFEEDFILKKFKYTCVKQTTRNVLYMVCLGSTIATSTLVRRGMSFCKKYNFPTKNLSLF